MTRRTITALAALAIPLGACGTSENADGLTAAEQRELDEAAAQLDASQADLEAIPQAPVEQSAEDDQGEP